MLADYQKARYVVISPMKYGVDDHQFEMGEFIEPAGFVRDRLLFGEASRWTMPAPDPAHREAWPCDRCGRHFLREDQLRAHQERSFNVEALSPEHATELRKSAMTSKRKELSQETVADVARKQGYDVEEVRSGPNRSQVPIIRMT